METIAAKHRRWANTAAFALTVAVNGLANAVELFGVKTQDVSQMYENLFTPAPATFAIWGVIYALLAGFILYQWNALGLGGVRSLPAAARVEWWFTGNCLLNALWLLCWHARLLGLCVALMAGILLTLIVLTERVATFSQGWKERWLVKAPFSIYFGWITVATIAGIAAWLTQLRWRGWGLSDQAWTVIALLLGLAIALVTAWRRRDALYALAVAWGCGGICWRHVSTTGYGGAYPAVVIVSAAATVVLAALGVWLLIREYRA